MKFKRVEIQAFKSYLDKRNGTFDFTIQEGQPADIISIYAPNGFGKTSFYDAIDFCMTNNITRFIRDKSLANVNNSDAKGMNQEGQKQYILRAKTAPENLESEIKIVTDTGNFERKVIPARTGSKDYSYEDKKTAPEERYFRSVMLSQEAIDGFLRELKPEIRYERFMEEQLGGDDILETNRQQIQLMLGGLNNRLKKLEGKVKKIRAKNILSDLGGESTFDSSSLTAINELVAELNTQGADFSAIDDTFDNESKARLLLQVAQLEESTSKSIETIQIEKAKLESLLNNFPLHEKNHHEIVELTSRISILTNQKSDIEQFQSLSEEKNVLTGHLKTRRSVLDALRSRERQLPNFVEVLQAKREQQSRVTRIREHLTKNKQSLKIKEAVNDELENQKTTLLSELKKYETLRNVAPEYFSEITRIEESIKQQGRTGLITESDALDKKIKDVKSKGVLLNGFKVEVIDVLLASKFENEVLSSIAKEHAKVLAEQKKYHKKIDEFQSLLNSAEKQAGSISTLIELGSQLVNHNQDHHCPLCQHKHESFAALADAINSNSSLSDTQQRLLKELETCQIRLKQEDDKLKQLSENFSIEQKSHLDSLREQLQNLLQEKLLLSDRLVQLEKDTVEVNRLKALTSQKKPELFQSYIENEITRVLAAISVLEAKIDGAKGECKELIKRAQKLKIDCAEAVSKSENGSDFIIEYSTFLAESKVPHDVIEPELNERALKGFISSQLEAALALFEESQQDIKCNDAAFKQLHTSYSIDFFEDVGEKKEALAAQLLKDSKKLVLLNGLVREFYSVVRVLEQDSFLLNNNWEFLKQAFEHKVIGLHHRAEQKRGLNSGLKSLCTQAEKVLIYIEVVKSTYELNSLNKEIKKCNGIKDKLLTDLRAINDSLKTQINHYFHVDLINKIYKKIDPHPDFKRITFKCEFPDEGKPKLQVYIEDEEGNNLISPTLDFSSAQINVLSLSIFLAKALNTKKAGKAVDCIFIDDPVQSMDSINVLGVIDLIRNLSVNLGKQIIISTHDENLHALLQQKLPQHLFKSKFLELESFGKVAAHAGQ